MIAGINCVQESKIQLRVGIAIGSAVILINWMGFLNTSSTIHFYFSFLFLMAFYIFVAGRLLRMMFKTPTVSMGVLYAALNVYLLLGIIGGFGFMLIDNAYSGSLNNLRLGNLTDPSKYIYFSFITLSTRVMAISPRPSPRRKRCPFCSAPRVRSASLFWWPCRLVDIWQITNHTIKKMKTKLLLHEL